jgi:vacuolar-type H+-ATPase subunit I/STV1
MINDELIDSRKQILITELQNLQDRIAELDREKLTLVANANAMKGALQQCDYFLGVLNEEGSKPVKEKKEKDNG